jgi:hypothetical protein
VWWHVLDFNWYPFDPFFLFYLQGFLLVLIFSDQVKHGPDADDGHDDGVRALDPSGFASSAIRCFVRELIQIFFALDVNKFYISTISQLYHP